MAKKTTKTPQIYLVEKLKTLNEQKNLHISKREGNQNLVYLNAQIHFITTMQEDLKLESN